jgi:intracellular septation protein A
MRDFLQAARFLLHDLASTIFFLVLYLLTHNTVLSVSAGIALGVAQVGNQILRGRTVGTMEWLSLFLLVAAGGATLVTEDLRFVLFKPSVLYAIAGAVMLRPGWLNRYVPDLVREVAPDVAMAVGFAWAGLMFVSAAVNAFLALTQSVAVWAMVMPTFGIVSKAVVFACGYAAIRIITGRRLRAMPAAQRDALLVAAGRQTGQQVTASP